MATPCSVKADGGYFRWRPRPVSKVTVCDLGRVASSAVSQIRKSSLNTSLSTVRQWEIGQKQPSGRSREARKASGPPTASLSQYPPTRLDHLGRGSIIQFTIEFYF